MLLPSSVRDDDALTPTQRQALREWLRVHEDHESREDPLKMALVIAGDKPAMYLQPSEWAYPGTRFGFDTNEQFRELIDALELVAHQIEGMNGWFVAPAHGRLDLLPSTVRAPTDTAWHRRLGVVLGYPPEAIEFFIDTTGAKRTQPRELVERGVLSPDELAYTQFVFYIHDDSSDGYERAIETGRAVRARFTELAEKWELPILETIAEEQYQLAVAVYSGERRGFPGETVDFKMIARRD